MSHLKFETRLLAALLCVLATAACTRDEVDKGVDRISAGAHRLAGKLDVSLHRAKNEAQHVKDKLPPAEEVKADLKKVGEDAKDKLRAASENLKKEARDARDSVREQFDREKK